MHELTANTVNLQDTSLWAVLAGWAVSAGEVDTAEVAFAGCEEVDKLQYMLYIKQLPTREARLAELALYRHNALEAEAILLQVRPAKASKSHCGLKFILYICVCAGSTQVDKTVFLSS